MKRYIITVMPLPIVANNKSCLSNSASFSSFIKPIKYITKKPTIVGIVPNGVKRALSHAPAKKCVNLS